jgi:L-threonylcarbamoyladenylate synthase
MTIDVTLQFEFAISAIKSDEIVAFPTETVYGLGGNARSEVAVSKIYHIKNRPAFNPLIVHVATLEQAMEIGVFNQDALKIAQHFWPGPITIVLPLKTGHNIAQNALGNLDTVAIRIPSHKIAQDLILKSGMPIVAPSANLSGYISATEYKHVKHFAEKGVTVLNDEYQNDNNQSVYCGLESTIVDLSNDKIQILRYGFITPKAISQILGKEVCVKRGDKIIAPGMLSKHYAPNTSLRINITNPNQNEIHIGFGDIAFSREYDLNLSKNGDIIEASRNLYSFLRIADEVALNNSFESIAIAPIANDGIGLAINDRITRASER